LVIIIIIPSIAAVYISLSIMCPPRVAWYISSGCALVNVFGGKGTRLRGRENDSNLEGCIFLNLILSLNLRSEATKTSSEGL
jgi:hypothetical protein